MKLLKSTFAALLMSGAAAQATTYTDASGDTIATSMMDILSVGVTNDATQLNFTINLGNNSDFISNAYTRLMIGFDTTAGGSSTANAWGNGATMPGMDYFAGGASSGMNFYSAALGGWPEWQNGNNNTWVGYSSVTSDLNGIQFSVPLATLGVSAGATFYFDVYTAFSDTGHPIDAAGLNNGSSTQSSWSTLPYDSGANTLSYTVAAVAVPEPSTYALVLGCLAGAMLVIRRRQKA